MCVMKAPCFLLASGCMRLCHLSLLPPSRLRRCRATHWKQTVFYLKDTLIVHQGEQITGERHSCGRGGGAGVGQHQ